MLQLLRHWLTELANRASTADVEAALGSLVIDVEGDVARIGPGVFTGIPTSEGRSRALAAAASRGREVRVHAPTTTSDASLGGRIAIDLPRRALRALRVPAAEPGDRFDGAYVHVFFDDEPIAIEAARVGLAFMRREGGWVTLEHGARAVHADSFARELLRALLFIGTAERLRTTESPERAVEKMRERGRRARSRGVVGRARLRRAIGWVDAAYRGPAAANCFRRVLTEIALDRTAAAETLVFGLDLGRTGHVTFQGSEDRSFDVAFEIP